MVPVGDIMAVLFLLQKSDKVPQKLMEMKQYVINFKERQMETLVNCDIIVDIESIDNVSGGNQEYEVYFTSVDNAKYKLVFDCAWVFRVSFESIYPGFVIKDRKMKGKKALFSINM